MGEQTISRTGTCYQNRLQRITQRGHKMIITHEINDLYDFQPWAGAVNTCETIVNADKGKQFMNELESIYPDGITDTQLNDLLWFESDWCLDLVGIVSESRKDELKKLFFEICEQSENEQEHYMGQVVDYMNDLLDSENLTDNEREIIDDNWDDWTSEYEQNKK